MNLASENRVIRREPDAMPTAAARSFLKTVIHSITLMAALFMLPMLLPARSTQLVLDLMCWVAVGALALLVLVAIVKLLEGLFDT